MPYTIVSETELLQEVAAGNEQAFNVLFNRHWDHLYNYMMRITKSHHVSEEIVTDVFLKLWTGRELVPNIQNMDAFLATVAYNKAMNFFKLSARNARLQKVISQSMQQNTDEVSADCRILDAEAVSILQNAIQKLSPRRRKIFTLSREHGLTHDQIASELNLSLQTVKNTMSDALSSLRSILQKNQAGSVILCYVWLMG